MVDYKEVIGLNSLGSKVKSGRDVKSVVGPLFCLLKVKKVPVPGNFFLPSLGTSHISHVTVRGCATC